MKAIPTQLLIGSFLALALAVPASAAAEACMGAGQFVNVEAAKGSIAVIPGKSIGPLAIGMTRRTVTDVAGRAAARTRYGDLRYRVSGMSVLVGFGRYGRVRTLRADSGKLTVDGVPLSAGPDAVVATLPGVERSECGTYTTMLLTQGRRQTGLGFFASPALPRVVIVNAAMRR